jgi:glycosyltransferase involved in cell wall biosynthesis
MGLDVVFVGDQAPVANHYITDIESLGITCFTGRKAGLRHLMSRGFDTGTALLSRPGVCERYLSLVRAFAPNATILYDTVDLHWVRLERAASVSNDPGPLLQSANRYHRVELVNARASDITIAITDDERKVLLAQDPELQVSVIPNIHDIREQVEPFGQRSGLFFIGSFVHLPNIEAVHYLVNEILPRVAKHIPDIRLHIVGSQMPDDIAALASDQVDPVGYVDDVSPWFNQSRLFVAPLLHGAGMKGKIGQALSFGLPVVTTTIGAEGMGLSDGDSALISDDPQDFAQRIVAAYLDATLWQRLSSNGQGVIARQFSPTTVRHRIAALIQAGDHHDLPADAKPS